MLGGIEDSTLASWLSWPTLPGPPSFPIASAGTRLFPVPPLPLSNVPGRRHHLPVHPPATQQMAPGHVSHAPGQEQRRRPGADAPPERQLSHRPVSQAQAYASDGGVGRQQVLEGRVEMDDAYLGSKRAGKPGRGSPNKAPFVAAVQTIRLIHSRYTRLSRMPGFTRIAIDAWANHCWMRRPWCIPMAWIASRPWRPLSIVIPSASRVLAGHTSFCSCGSIHCWAT
jgi:hypothetical protein